MGEKSNERQSDKEVDESESGGIFPELGELGAGAIVSEQGLARIFKRHPASIKRAVERGELPPPIHILKRPCWTVGAILRHLEARQEEEAGARERLERKFGNLRS